MELDNNRGRWGMAGLVSVGSLFHPKDQVEEQDGSLQVKILMGENSNALEGVRILHSLEIPM